MDVREDSLVDCEWGAVTARVGMLVLVLVLVLLHL